MKIEINLKIILLLILIVILNKIEIYMLFIIFILCHELSHMVMGIILGFKPKTLRLNPLGVSIEFYNYDENNKKNKWKRILTYLAGPLINLLIGIFNLLPILPLDGGKVLKEILKLIYNPKIASIFMINITKSILIIVSLIYSIVIFQMKNFMIFLLIVYLWYLYYVEEKKERLMVRVYEALEKQ